MADPFTIIALGATVASTVISMEGQRAQGEAETAAARYRAQVARQNRQYELMAGEQRQFIAGTEAAQRIGGIVAGFAGRNLDVARGSPAAVARSQHEVGMYKQRQILADTARKAYGLESEANLLDYSARNAQTSAQIRMASTFASGVASVAGKWAGASDLNVFGPTTASNQVSLTNPYGIDNSYQWPT